MTFQEALKYIKQEYKARRTLDEYGRVRYLTSFDGGETFIYSPNGEEWYKTEITEEDLNADWTVVWEETHELH